MSRVVFDRVKDNFRVGGSIIFPKVRTNGFKKCNEAAKDRREI
jgi:hypothetical protein